MHTTYINAHTAPWVLIDTHTHTLLPARHAHVPCFSFLFFLEFVFFLSILLDASKHAKKIGCACYAHAMRTCVCVCVCVCVCARALSLSLSLSSAIYIYTYIHTYISHGLTILRLCVSVCQCALRLCVRDVYIYLYSAICIYNTYTFISHGLRNLRLYALCRFKI